MYDFHVHSNFSNDCSIEMERYVLQAMEKGLQGICFTDHADIGMPGDEINYQFDYYKYIEELESLREKYANRIEILSGIEFGMQPHILEIDKSYFKDKSFDYVLGSLHAAGRIDLYESKFTEGRNDHITIVEYFQDMIYCLKNFKYYNNLGHLDGIARYVDTGSFDAPKYMDYIEEALRTIIDMGKGIELNTSGKRYRLPYFHPEPSILKAYKSLGGEIITLGSDSHNPSTLSYGFTEALDLLQSCGFKYYTIFKRGKPEFIKLK